MPWIPGQARLRATAEAARRYWRDHTFAITLAGLSCVAAAAGLFAYSTREVPLVTAPPFPMEEQGRLHAEREAAEQAAHKAAQEAHVQREAEKQMAAEAERKAAEEARARAELEARQAVETQRRAEARTTQAEHQAKEELEERALRMPAERKATVQTPRPKGPAPGADKPRLRSVAPAAPSESASRRAQSSAVATPEIPVFPWPPPRPSASRVVPSGLLFGPWERSIPVTDLSRSYYYFGLDLPQLYSTRGPLLAHVDAVLVNALASAGYAELSYYAVPDGFALVTRMEQINPDGTPSAERWPSDGRGPQFSIAQLIRQLLYARPGLYRVVVFIVSPAAFTSSSRPVSAAQAEDWVSGGANVLPRALSIKRYSADHTCTALVYEFERADDPTKSRVNHPGRLTSDAHLERSGIQRAMVALAKGN